MKFTLLFEILLFLNMNRIFQEKRKGQTPFLFLKEFFGLIILIGWVLKECKKNLTKSRNVLYWYRLYKEYIKENRSWSWKK